MAALPIYVHVPKFYADVLGLNLIAIGGLLLAARVFDAIQDPLLGYWSDLARDRRAGRMLWVALGTPFLALGMLGLFRPPAWDAAALTWWLIAMLMLVYTAFSMVQISYQAYGAEISDHPLQRTRVTSFREGLGLVGVFLAAALPEILAKSSGPREGFAQFAVIFTPLVLLLVTVTILFSPKAPVRTRAAPQTAFRTMLKPLRNRSFNRLLLIFVFNGIAASIPATLVLFFIEDVIQNSEAFFDAGGIRGKSQVQSHDGRLFLVHSGNRAFPVFSQMDIILRRQRPFHLGAQILIIIDNQQFLFSQKITL